MSNVRNAVTKVDEAKGQVEPAKPSVATVVRQAVEQQSAAFRQVLPRHVDPDRFARLVMQACKTKPDLLKCFGTQQGGSSVLLSAMQAAIVGLEPDTPTEECWLTPRRNKGVWECQLTVGYKGYLKLALRSPNIKTVIADAVHAKDHFRWQRGLDTDVFEHRPYEGSDNDRGELTHAYCIVRYVTGGYVPVILGRIDVEARRAMSDTWRADQRNKTEHSPWSKWPKPMWVKSAIRAAKPYLDLTPEAAAAMDADDARLSFDDEAGVIEIGSVFGALTNGDDDDDDGAAEPAEQPSDASGSGAEQGKLVGKDGAS